MAFCTNCGKQVADGVKFCTSCGTPMASYIPPAPPPAQTAPPQAAPVPQQPVYAVPVTVRQEEPISTGEYIGIFLLMIVPLVNLICLLIWACGGCKKVNKRNLARAMLVLILIRHRPDRSARAGRRFVIRRHAQRAKRIKYSIGRNLHAINK